MLHTTIDLCSRKSGFTHIDKSVAGLDSIRTQWNSLLSALRSKKNRKCPVLKCKIIIQIISLVDRREDKKKYLLEALVI